MTRRSGTVRILVRLLHGRATAEQIAIDLGLYPRNVSRGLSHLQELGFAEPCGTAERESNNGLHPHVWRHTLTRVMS